MEETLLLIDPFWIWLILGGILLAVEVLIVPSGFFLCVGTAACIVGGIIFFLPHTSFEWSLSLFAILSVLACYGWWIFLRKRKGGIDEKETDASLNLKSHQLKGHRAVLAEPLRNGKGRLRINDSSWPVEADEDYPAGIRVEVLEVSGITLKIQAVREQ